MGLPITYVDYKFTLSVAEATIFDEILSSYQSNSCSKIRDVLLSGGEGETFVQAEKNFDSVTGVINIIAAGADVHQEG